MTKKQFFPTDFHGRHESRSAQIVVTMTKRRVSMTKRRVSMRLGMHLLIKKKLYPQKSFLRKNCTFQLKYSTFFDYSITWNVNKCFKEVVLRALHYKQFKVWILKTRACILIKIAKA